jgi:hypothetical protein
MKNKIHLCVPSETGVLGASYVDGAIVNPPTLVWPNDVFPPKPNTVWN